MTLRLMVNGFSKHHRPVLDALLAQPFVDDCLVLHLGAVSFPAGKRGTAYDIERLKYAEYRGVNWDLIAPLDETVIRDMAVCETDFLKMAERFRGPALPYDDRKRIYLRHLRYWSHLLDEKPVDAFLSSNVPHLGLDYVIFRLCERRGIPTLMLYSLPQLPRETIAFHVAEGIEEPAPELPQRIRDLEVQYQHRSTAQIELPKFLEVYVSRHQQIGVLPTAYNAGAKVRTTLGRRLLPALRELRAGRVAPVARRVLVGGKKFVKDLQPSRVRERRRMERLCQLYDVHAQDPVAGERYVYLTLARQPECSTAPLAGVFVNQLLIAQLISFCLPPGVFLYVKEYPWPPGMAGRDQNFYADLRELPNVRLIRRDYNTYKLLDGALAAATATGSLGVEAIGRGIPLLMFGSRVYQYAPGVFKVRSVDDCRTAIAAILEGRAGPTERGVRLFLKALEPISAEGFVSIQDRRHATVDADRNVENVLSLLLPRLRGLNDTRRGAPVEVQTVPRVRRESSMSMSGVAQESMT